MDLLEHLFHARQAAESKAAARRATQMFELHWRGTGSEYVVGWSAVCAILGMKEQSLAVRLSQHKNKYSIRRINPAHGAEDVLTISRISTDKAAKRLRGRPPKAVDWERLGPNAPGNPDNGIVLAPPARTMPKTRIRRTREKR